MTFAHKLARRLAVARPLPPHSAMFPALLLMAACSAGVPTGVDSALNPADAQVVVNPRSLILETNQASVFKAYATGVPGDSLVTSIEWTATGGSISLDGTYASPSTGDFKVVGKRHGPNRTTSDTATVVVVPPQPSVTQVVVSPSPATVTAKTQQTFSAVGKLSDGSTVAIGVIWTATGGSIDAGGVYTAGATAGTYQVIAKAASANVADTTTVTVAAAQSPAPPSGARPHEPAGYRTMFNVTSWTAVPPNNPAFDANGFTVWGGRENLSLQADAPPGYTGNSLQVLYYQGLQAGYPPVNWGARGVNHTFKPNTGRIYTMVWVKVMPGWTNASNPGTKFFGFKTGTYDTGANTMNHYLGFNADPTAAGMDPSFNLQGPFQGNNFSGANVAGGGWHQIEVSILPNTPGVANGTLQVWVDGALKVNKVGTQGFFGTNNTDVEWDALYPGMATFGGVSSSCPQNQWMRIGPWYTSVN